MKQFSSSTSKPRKVLARVNMFLNYNITGIAEYACNVMIPNACLSPTLSCKVMPAKLLELVHKYDLKLREEASVIIYHFSGPQRWELTST